MKVEGTNIGTQTNAKGGTPLMCPKAKPNWLFSYIGYQNKKIRIGKSDIAGCFPGSLDQALNEVVVTGYAAQAKAGCNRGA